MGVWAYLFIDRFVCRANCDVIDYGHLLVQQTLAAANPSFRGSAVVIL
jgi:hypothetical protein